MNKDQVEGNWHQMKGAIKEKWGKLTDDDIATAKGKTEALAGRIQERYGITKEEAEKQWKEFSKTQPSDSRTTTEHERAKAHSHS